MFRRVASRSSLRIAFVFLTCISLISNSNVFWQVSRSAQAQIDARNARPRANKPEGVWPNLEDVKAESQLQREAPPPIPSTIRSRKNRGKPWDGRRVGDAEPQQQQLAQAKVVERRRRHAHARRRSIRLYQCARAGDDCVQRLTSLGML